MAQEAIKQDKNLATDAPAVPVVVKPQVVATQTNDDFEAAAGKGMQSVGFEDLALPFLVILQSNSPQCKKSDGAYIKGAEEGMVYNTVTNELFDTSKEPLVGIPCGFERKMLLWKPRETGGGLLGIYDRNDPIVSQARREGSRDVTPDGNYLSNTAQHYVMLLYPDGTYKQVVIGMVSTQLKKSRRWLTLITSKVMQGTKGPFNPPSFSHRYVLSTQAESNEKGSWFGWHINEGPVLDIGKKDAPGPDRNVYQACLKFSEAVAKGTIKVSQPPTEAGHPQVDDDIPF